MEFGADEQVFFHGHPSWRSILDFYFKGLVLTVVAGAIAGVASDIADGKVKVAVVAVVVVIGLVIMIVGGLVKRIATTYTITNRRLTIHSGIFSREMHETRLERVQNVNSTQTVIERILGIGTVDFDTAAGAEFDFRFRGVDNPHEIVHTVDTALQDLQDQGAETPKPPAGV